MAIFTPKDGVWGWPWHGLGSAYGLSGCPVSGLFKDGQAWLLDANLAAISLTADESDEATANGWEWRNYAFVSGGKVYATDLQTDSMVRKDSLIYFDANAKPWLLRVSVARDNDDITVSADVVAFGIFDGGTTPHTPFNIEADAVTCADLSALDSPSAAEMGWTIEDVWTNGGKFLVSVQRLLTTTFLGNSVTYKDIHSLIEVEVTGTSEATLSLEATEVRGGNQTTYEDISSPGSTFAPTLDLSTVDSCAGTETLFATTNWPAAAGLVDGRDVTWVYARNAHYDSDGDPVLMRLRRHETTDSSVTASGVTLDETGVCGSGGLTQVYTASIEAQQIAVTTADLLADSTVVATFGYSATSDWSVSYTHTILCIQASGLPGEPCDTIYTQATGGGAYGVDSVTNAWQGYLSGQDADAVLPYDWDHLFLRWRMTTVSVGDIENFDYTPRYASLVLTDGVDTIGSAGFIIATSNAIGPYHMINTSVMTLGDLTTPTGAQSYGSTLATPYKLYHAWNRQSGAQSFGTSPVCYV